MVPVVLEVEEIGRYSQEIESAIYFSCLEALQNVAKYANASRVTIALARAAGHVTVSVTDDGAGFDTGSTTQGSGLRGIEDRLDALGGTVRIESSMGTGTTVGGSVPIAPLR